MQMNATDYGVTTPAGQTPQARRSLPGNADKCLICEQSKLSISLKVVKFNVYTIH